VIFGAVDTDTALNQPASSRPNELKNPSLAMRTSVQSRPSIQVLADRLAARSAAQATDSERFFPRGEVGASKERHAAAANAARLAPTTGWQTAQGSVPNATPPMASANPWQPQAAMVSTYSSPQQSGGPAFSGAPPFVSGFPSGGVDFYGSDEEDTSEQIETLLPPRQMETLLPASEAKIFLQFLERELQTPGSKVHQALLEVRSANANAAPRSTLLPASAPLPRRSEAEHLPQCRVLCALPPQPERPSGAQDRHTHVTRTRHHVREGGTSQILA
jgi:hypothetical protein